MTFQVCSEAQTGALELRLVITKEKISYWLIRIQKEAKPKPDQENHADKTKLVGYEFY